MKWYKVTLTKDQVEKKQGQRLVEELQEIYEEEDEPEELALFSVNDKLGGVTYYFPPSTVKYALIIFSFYCGTRCHAPQEEEVALVLGDSNAKDRFIL